MNWPEAVVVSVLIISVCAMFGYMWKKVMED